MNSRTTALLSISKSMQNKSSRKQIATRCFLHGDPRSSAGTIWLTMNAYLDSGGSWHYVDGNYPSWLLAISATSDELTVWRAPAGSTGYGAKMRLYNNGKLWVEGDLVCGGDLKVKGNDIKDSNGNVKISFDATNNYTKFLGDGSKSATIFVYRYDNAYYNKFGGGTTVVDSTYYYNRLNNGGNTVIVYRDDDYDMVSYTYGSSSVSVRKLYYGSLVQSSTIKDKIITGVPSLEELARIIDHINIYRFYYKHRDENYIERPIGKEQIGAIVEELDEKSQKIPEIEYIIERDSEGEPSGINTNALIFVLIAKIKQLEERLNACRCHNRNKPLSPSDNDISKPS